MIALDPVLPLNFEESCRSRISSAVAPSGAVGWSALLGMRSMPTKHAFGFLRITGPSFFYEQLYCRMKQSKGFAFFESPTVHSPWSLTTSWLFLNSNKVVFLQIPHKVGASIDVADSYAWRFLGFSVLKASANSKKNIALVNIPTGTFEFSLKEIYIFFKRFKFWQGGFKNLNIIFARDLSSRTILRPKNLFDLVLLCLTITLFVRTEVGIRARSDNELSSLAGTTPATIGDGDDFTCSGHLLKKFYQLFHCRSPNA